MIIARTCPWIIGVILGLYLVHVGVILGLCEGSRALFGASGLEVSWVSPKHGWHADAYLKSHLFDACS